MRVLAVAKYLRNIGVDTLVLYPLTKDKEYEHYLAEARIRFIREELPPLRAASYVRENIRFLLKLWPASKQVMSVIKREHINIVHANGITNIQPVIAGVCMNIPVIWHWNDTLTPKWFGRLIRPLIRMKNVHLVIAAKAIQDKYDLLSLKSQVPVLPAPVNTFGKVNEYSWNVRKSLGLRQGALLIGFVGQLVKAKGCDDFVKVIGALLNEGYDVHGLMLGGALPSQKKYALDLRAFISEKGLVERIHLLGFRGDVQEILAQVDTFLFPSYSEACPIAVLEAMSVGVPIVSTRVGDVPYMTEGIDIALTEPGDIEALTAGVKRMLDASSEERSHCKEQMLKRVRSTYSLEKVAEMHEEIYSKSVCDGF